MTQIQFFALLVLPIIVIGGAAVLVFVHSETSREVSPILQEWQEFVLDFAGNRLLFGMILGAALTLGGAYLADSATDHALVKFFGSRIAQDYRPSHPIP